MTSKKERIELLVILQTFEHLLPKISIRGEDHESYARFKLLQFDIRDPFSSLVSVLFEEVLFKCSLYQGKGTIAIKGGNQVHKSFPQHEGPEKGHIIEV